MSVVVSLKDVVDALDISGQTRECFLDPESGEILLITEDDQLALEQAEDELVPEWQREHLQEARKLLDSNRGLRLPNSFDIHEWSIMENFCYTIVETGTRETMLDSIHRKGAFSRFREVLERFDLQQEWFSFRESAFKQIARDWLEVNGISYKE